MTEDIALRVKALAELVPPYSTFSTEEAVTRFLGEKMTDETRVLFTLVLLPNHFGSRHLASPTLTKTVVRCLEAAPQLDSAQLDAFLSGSTAGAHVLKGLIPLQPSLVLYRESVKLFSTTSLNFKCVALPLLLLAKLFFVSDEGVLRLAEAAAESMEQCFAPVAPVDCPVEPLVRDPNYAGVWIGLAAPSRRRTVVSRQSPAIRLSVCCGTRWRRC